MLKNLWTQFVKKGLYALLGFLLGQALIAVTNYHPTNPTIKMLWPLILYPAATGLIALLKRWFTYDPAKAAAK